MESCDRHVDTTRSADHPFGIHIREDTSDSAQCTDIDLGDDTEKGDDVSRCGAAPGDSGELMRQVEPTARALRRPRQAALGVGNRVYAELEIDVRAAMALSDWGQSCSLNVPCGVPKLCSHTLSGGDQVLSSCGDDRGRGAAA